MMNGDSKPVFLCCKKCQYELTVIQNAYIPFTYHMDVICPNCDATIDSIDKVDAYTCTCENHIHNFTFKQACYLDNKEQYK